VATPTAGLQAIGSGQINILDNLVTAETGFNTNLLTSELTWEAGAFGPNAFNGGLNGIFDVGNGALLTVEQTVNSFLFGLQVPVVAPPPVAVQPPPPPTA
jgi:hypothetical protein